MRRVFTPDEWVAIRGNPGSLMDSLNVLEVQSDLTGEQTQSIHISDLRSDEGMQMVRFMTIWAAKESYVKFVGAGGLKSGPTENLYVQVLRSIQEI